MYYPLKIVKRKESLDLCQNLQVKKAEFYAHGSWSVLIPRLVTVGFKWGTRESNTSGIVRPPLGPNTITSVLFSLKFVYV